MRLFFEIREGPNRGLKAPVTPGLQIGRAVAFGMRLKDPKASAVHAEVVLDEAGQLVLVDKGSTNQIKSTGRRVATLALFAGASFRIGNTRFHVVAEETEKKSNVDRLEEKQQERPEWRQALVDYFRSSDLRVHEYAVDIRPFVPPVEIEVTRGFQIGTIWTLGYGPREFGRACAELSIWDENCPNIAFKVSPSASGRPSLQVHDDVALTVNGQSTAAETLSDGDLIGVGETELKIRFL